jgi:PPOX class probable F420-dependent enzyme
MGIDLDRAFEFVGANHHGVLVTMRANGRPQLSNIVYASGGAHSVRISVTDSRSKTVNLSRDDRASLHVTQDDFYAYVVLDGTAALSPVAADPHDPVVDELADMYRLSVGDHPDWDLFRQAMVTDRRLVVTFTATYAYGMLAS